MILMQPLTPYPLQILQNGKIVQFLQILGSFLKGRFSGKNKYGLFGITFLIYCKLESDLLLVRGGGGPPSHSPNLIEPDLARGIVLLHH